ncbi:MAG TPA: hypothetical protein VMF55_03785 [Solirubrobacterales bacterium]|nr:hypothetical protein [Solirubrobacterales bacterium]
MHIRGRLTYANVMATIAVFIALGGASYAAVKLPKNSVGTKQIKKEAVTAAKIKNGAVTGSKVNLATFGAVPSATHATTADNAGHAETAATAGGAPPTGAAGGDLTGTYPKPTLAAKAVGTSNLADAAVTTSKLAPAAVASTNLAAGAVDAANLGSITEATALYTGTGIIHGPSNLNELEVQCPTGTRVISGGFQSGTITDFNPSASYRKGNGWVAQGYIPSGTVTVEVFAYCLG